MRSERCLHARRSAAAVLAVAACLCFAGASHGRSARTVLAIHSGAGFSAANDALDAAIRDALVPGMKHPVDYFAEYLDNDRFGAAAAPALADYVREKYRGRRIDLVIAVTNESLRFV